MGLARSLHDGTTELNTTATNALSHKKKLLKKVIKKEKLPGSAPLQAEKLSTSSDFPAPLASRHCQDFQGLFMQNPSSI